MMHTEEDWLFWIDQLSENNYVVIDDFLRDGLFEIVCSFFDDHLDQFHQAGIGSLDQHQIIKGIRGDHTYWLDSGRDTSLIGFWDLVNETMQTLNRFCFLSLSGFEFHLAHYPPQTFYKMHLDQFKDRNNRMISVVIYLNKNWQEGDGGELSLIDNLRQKVIVQPIANRCVMFKSAEVPHEVLLAQKDRYSLTGWLLYHPAALGQFLG